MSRVEIAVSDDGQRRILLSALIQEMTVLRSELLALESDGLVQGTSIHPSYRDSARNLLHYLALRGRDMRELQEQLASLGLSSLGRSEAHVLATLNSVWGILHQISGKEVRHDETVEAPINRDAGKRLLARHTEALLGPKPDDRNTRIMVTLPAEAAQDSSLARALLEAGMNCARINCAHDNVAVWEQMIGHLRTAQRELGKPCRLLMDLAGPKLRTGPVSFGLQVVKWRPRRDRHGRVTAPARVQLIPRGVTAECLADTTQLPVASEWLARVRVGDRIDFVDARGARRFLFVVGQDDEGCWAEGIRTSYVTPGTTLRLRNRDRRLDRRTSFSTAVGDLPPTEQALMLKPGDSIVLTGQREPASPAEFSSDGSLLSPARVGCTLPEIFADVRPGERIWFDDGKIGGVIEAVSSDGVSVLITHCSPSGAKLRGDKGINLPDSRLNLPALTAKDLADLPFIAAHADLVGYSFVRSAEDVVELEERMIQVGGEQLGIVLKIETRRAFEELPSLLLAAMRSPCDGVMIARGDLAIECGYEQMAEVQEQILWVCEAAHVPVIWATQVLESLAKSGLPSRAEISDAAIGQRAECVMLNKGPHIVRAVRSLADILCRMEAHQTKKQSTLRPLDLARRFLARRKGGGSVRTGRVE